MKILFLGDVVGRTGRDAAVACLPRLRAALQIDLPTGATIVCTFAMVLILMAIVRIFLLRRKAEAAT